MANLAWGLTVFSIFGRMLPMLAIRLQRVGRKNDPSFRVIVADTKLKPRTGNFLEVIGSYDARKGAPVIDVARAKHWISVGAKPSGTVHNLLHDLKVVSGKKVNVLGRKTPIIPGAPAEEVKAPAVPAAKAPEPEVVEAAPVVEEAGVAEAAPAEEAPVAAE